MKLEDIAQQFSEHAHSDEGFQRESRDMHTEIREALEQIKNKLDPQHEEYINRDIESRMASMEAKFKPWEDFTNSFSFGRRVIIGTAGIAGAIAVITTSVMTVLRLFKP